MLTIENRFTKFTDWITTFAEGEDVVAVCAVAIPAIVCAFTLGIGVYNYYANSYHNMWALRLLQIAPASLAFASFFFYSLMKWRILFGWMPFQRSTRLWTGIPLNFWVVLSVLWCFIAYPSLLLLYVAVSFISIFNFFVIELDGTKGILAYLAVGIWYIIQTIGVGFCYPNGSAMKRIKDIWCNNKPKSQPTTPTPPNTKEFDALKHSNTPKECRWRDLKGNCHNFSYNGMNPESNIVVPCQYTPWGQPMCPGYITVKEGD